MDPLPCIAHAQGNGPMLRNVQGCMYFLAVGLFGVFVQSVLRNIAVCWVMSS